jgi:pentatricopeptide repeat protein
MFQNTDTGLLPYLNYARKNFPKSDNEFLQTKPGTLITLFKTFGKFKEIEALNSLTEKAERLTKVQTPDLLNSMIGSAFESAQYENAEKFIKIRVAIGALSLKTYEIIIRGYANSGEMDKAREWFSEMKQVFKHPSEVSYHFLLNGYGKVGDYVNLEKVLDEIQQTFGTVSPWVYHVVIRAVSLKDQKKAFDYFYRSIDEAKEPLIESYNWLLAGFTRKNEMVEAEKFLLSLLKDGVRPTAETFNHLLHAYAKQRKVETFDQTIATMKRVRVKPDPATYTLMLKNALSVGKDDQIMILLQDIKSNRMLPQGGFFSISFEYLGTKGKMDLAEEVFNETKVFKMVVPNRALEHLVSGFEKANLKEKAEHYKKLIQ